MISSPRLPSSKYNVLLSYLNFIPESEKSKTFLGEVPFHRQQENICTRKITLLLKSIFDLINLCYVVFYQIPSKLHTFYS